MDDNRIRIHISQGTEREHWAKALGITQKRLREVVRETGPIVENVKRYLIERIERAH